MKRELQILSLSALAVLSYGCNEKISPELENGNSTTTTTVIPPETYYFQITNKSPTVLNYVLHRTGAGRASTPCRVESTSTAFSSDLFISDKLSAASWDDRTLDISCFFEAEELSLHFNGLKFGIEASKNTCEYIGYTPYSFLQAIPGDSSSTYTGITCDGSVTSAQAATATPAASVPDYGAGPTKIGCEQLVDNNISVATRTPVSADDLQALCKFDYETNGGGNGKNCDIGTITYTQNIVSDFDHDNNPATSPVQIVTAGVPKVHSCGGKIMNCVGGPVKTIAGATTALTTDIFATEANADFSKEYTLSALIGKRAGQYDIVNHRRGLSNQEIEFGDYVTPTNWNSLFIKAFDPSVMANYSANLYPDGLTTILTSAEINAKAIAGVTTKRKPLAGDPFLGYGGARVNPFYTFYCMDRAYEIKARIRMVVRDWDRVFPSNTDELELITDSHLATQRQDLPSADEELPGEAGVSYNYFNDKDDWDNLVLMKKTDRAGATIAVWQAANPALDAWWPVDSTGATAWWDPSIFPNQGDDF